MAPQIRARLLNADEQRIEVGVREPEGHERTMWFASAAPVWEAPPPTLDFAAVALAHYAAFRGYDLHLEGPATAAQLDHLDEFLGIWAIWRPDAYRRVAVSAEEERAVRPLEEIPSRSAMAYSGGVDAGFALAFHHDGGMSRVNRQIELGVLGVRSDRMHDHAAVAVAQATAERVLSEYGVRLAVITNNWREGFCDKWFMSFNTGYMALLHTFAATHGAGIHATDHNYRLEMRLPPYGSHTSINHLLGSPSFPIISTGGTHKRIERVEYLASHPTIANALRVCYQEDAGGTNCGHCEKCVRTQLEMRAVGMSQAVDAAFPSKFELDDLRTARANNATVVMHFEDILERLDPEDPARPEVEKWLRDKRPITPKEGRRLRRRLRATRRELEAAKAQLAQRPPEGLVRKGWRRLRS